MSGSLTPFNASPEVPVAPYGAYPAPYPDPTAADDEGGSIQWARYIAALKRFKWVMLLIVLVGTLIGVIASRFIKAPYETNSTLWISNGTPLDQRNNGPIRTQELLSAYGWVELFRSYAVADRVVDRLALYVQPAQASDSLVFAGFQRDTTVRLGLGDFKLAIDASGQSFRLMTGDSTTVQRGVVGDSIGKKLGFRWAPTPAALGRNRTVEFSIIAPRAAAKTLVERIYPVLPEGSQFLQLYLSGDNPATTVRTLNTYMDEFVNTAAELKTRNLRRFSAILDEQLERSRQQMNETEGKLQNFRVRTITQPSEGTAVAAGTSQIQDPVVSNFFANRFEVENTKRDREALQRVLAETKGPALATALLSLPSVVSSDPPLQATLTAIYQQQAELNKLRGRYQEDWPALVQARTELERLQTQTLPQQANAILERLHRRERELDLKIAGASSELQKMPVRSMDENRLRRDFEVSEGLYKTLQSRFETAKLAEQSSIPDVSVLSYALSAQRPTKSKAGLWVLMAFAGSLALAVGVALGADRLDGRFRYPEQAKDELGLNILGAVPRIRKADEVEDPEASAQLIEAFRTIRLQLSHSFATHGPIVLTVSSPGEGDGKTTVSSNLALSFAESGLRTLLIDGDTRRGQLHTIFDVPRRPGLLDYMTGTTALDEVLRTSPTSANLTLMTSGIRRHRGPELIASDEMPRLIASLRAHFDVIIVDSPPLAAGIDAFALAAATGSLVVVLRAGTTDRNMAQAKMQLLDRLPVQVLGAVLNDIEAGGAYKHYAYIGSYYAAEDEEDATHVFPSGTV